MFKRLSYFKRPYIYISIAIIAVLIALYFATISPIKSGDEFSTITRGDIIQEVLLTGVVKAAESATLSFDRGGKVRTFPKQNGMLIPAGAVIATLEAGAEQAAVAEAESHVASAEIALRKVMIGTRPEELRVKEAEVAKTETMLQNLIQKTGTIIADGYNEADIALNRRADPLFNNDGGQTPRLSFGSGSQLGVYQAETERFIAGMKLQELKAFLGDESTEAEARLSGAIENVNKIQALFITLSGILTEASGLDETTLNDYRERVGTARTNISLTIVSLQNHLSAIREIATSREKAKRELELGEAGATNEDIENAEQSLIEARARLDSAKAMLAKTVLHAPFAGSVSARKAEVGETISAGTAIANFIGASGFVIEAQVPEADVTKVRIRDEVEVTLDAYGNDVIFHARASEIEQGEILIDGVPTYKATFAFEDKDSGQNSPRTNQNGYSPRSGMTANITVKNVMKKDVLLVPQKAIIEESGKRFVHISVSGNTPELREVTTGARGEGGVIELLAGAVAGERLLIPIQE